MSNAPTRQIFKVQKPLAGGLYKILVYNEDRSTTLLVDGDAGLDRLFEEHGPKVFVEGQSHKGAFAYGRVVPDPGW